MVEGLYGVLNPDQIRTMIVIAEQGSFNKAATTLGVKQSAVNQQITRLEDKVGRRLFDRTARGVTLTLDGEAVVIYSRAMAKLGRDMSLHLSRTGPEAVLRLGFNEDFGRTALPAVLGLFARQHANFRFEAVCSGSAETLFRAIDARELDVVVTRQIPGESRGEALWTEKTTWVGRADLTMPIADPVPLVLPPPGGLRSTILTALQGASRTWRVVFESAGVATLEAAVRAGLGLSACPVRMDLIDLVHLDAAAGLPELAHSIFVFDRARPARSEAIDAFCEVLRISARLSFAPQVE